MPMAEVSVGRNLTSHAALAFLRQQALNPHLHRECCVPVPCSFHRTLRRARRPLDCCEAVKSKLLGRRTPPCSLAAERPVFFGMSSAGILPAMALAVILAFSVAAGVAAVSSAITATGTNATLDLATLSLLYQPQLVFIPVPEQALTPDIGPRYSGLDPRDVTCPVDRPCLLNATASASSASASPPPSCPKGTVGLSQRFATTSLEGKNIEKELLVCSVCAEVGQYCDGSIVALKDFSDPDFAQSHLVCPPGRWCPNAFSVVECPSGFFCEAGSDLPAACPPLAYCPAGSASPARLMKWLLLLAVLAFLLVALFLRRTAAAAALFQNQAVVLYAQRLSTPLRRWLAVARHKIWMRSACEGPDPLHHRGTSITLEWKDHHFGDHTSRNERKRTMLPEALVRSTEQLQGVSVVLTDITLTLRATQRQILSRLNLSFEKGKVHAILSRTGVGKSLLLELLAGVSDPQAVACTGFVSFVNGDGKNSITRNRLALLSQNEAVPEHLTIDEALRAQLRLQRCIERAASRGGHDKCPVYSSEDDDALIEGLERLLDLFSIRHNLVKSNEQQQQGSSGATASSMASVSSEHEVGCGRVRGLFASSRSSLGTDVSGGQRKRLALAMEIVRRPQLLLTDELASSSDAATAQRLFRILKGLAKECGTTVIASVHSVREKVFASFDSVTLLSEGGCCYHGPPSFVAAYFHSLGFPGFEHRLTAQHRGGHEERANTEKSPRSSSGASSSSSSTISEATLAATSLPDLVLDVLSGVVPRKGFPSFHPSDLLVEWESQSALGLLPWQLARSPDVKIGQDEDPSAGAGMTVAGTGLVPAPLPPALVVEPLPPAANSVCNDSERPSSVPPPPGSSASFASLSTLNRPDSTPPLSTAPTAASPFDARLAAFQRFRRRSSMMEFAATVKMAKRRASHAGIAIMQQRGKRAVTNEATAALQPALPPRQPPNPTIGQSAAILLSSIDTVAAASPAPTQPLPVATGAAAPIDTNDDAARPHNPRGSAVSVGSHSATAGTESGASCNTILVHLSTTSNGGSTAKSEGKVTSSNSAVTFLENADLNLPSYSVVTSAFHHDQAGSRSHRLSIDSHYRSGTTTQLAPVEEEGAPALSGAASPPAFSAIDTLEHMTELTAHVTEPSRRVSVASSFIRHAASIGPPLSLTLTATAPSRLVHPGHTTVADNNASSGVSSVVIRHLANQAEARRDRQGEESQALSPNETGMRRRATPSAMAAVSAVGFAVEAPTISKPKQERAAQTGDKPMQAVVSLERFLRTSAISNFIFSLVAWLGFAFVLGDFLENNSAKEVSDVALTLLDIRADVVGAKATVNDATADTLAITKRTVMASELVPWMSHSDLRSAWTLVAAGVLLAESLLSLIAGSLSRLQRGRPYRDGRPVAENRSCVDSLLLPTVSFLVAASCVIILSVSSEPDVTLAFAFILLLRTIPLFVISWRLRQNGAVQLRKLLAWQRMAGERRKGIGKVVTPARPQQVADTRLSIQDPVSKASAALFCLQLPVFSKRALLQRSRQSSGDVAILLVLLALGLVLGFLFSGISLNSTPLKSLLVSLIVALAGGASGNKALAGGSRALFLRENSFGNSAFAAFLSADVASLPLALLQPLSFIVGFTLFGSSSSFFFQLALLTALSWCCSGLGLLATASAPHDASTAMVSLVAASSIFNGFNPSLRDLRDLLGTSFLVAWSPIRWADEALFLKETAAATAAFRPSFEALAEQFGFVQGREWLCFVAIIALGCIWRALGFLALLMSSRHLQRKGKGISCRKG